MSATAAGPALYWPLVADVVLTQRMVSTVPKASKLLPIIVRGVAYPRH